MRYVVRALAVILAAFIAVFAGGCKKKHEANKVPLDQIEADDSNDYRYIFRDRIQEQEERIKKEKNNEFK